MNTKDNDRLEKLNCEIQQVAMAIDYFERAIQDGFFTIQVERDRKTIHKLNLTMKKLEKKRDELTSRR